MRILVAMMTAGALVALGGGCSGKPDDSKPAAPSPPGAFRIEVVEPSGARELVSDEPVVRIGRTPSSEVQLQDEAVSRVHAMFERGPEGVMLTDLGTMNTRVNGSPV